MVPFMGILFQTHQVKNKPIGEGYKLFNLSMFCDFVVNATPAGRTATNSGEGKIESDSNSNK